MPTDDRRSTVLYRATLAVWMRLLSIGLGVFVTIIFGAPLLRWLTDRIGPAWVPVYSATMLVIMLGLIIIGNRSSFIVAGDGITVRGYIRTVRIPWREVAAIEVDSRWHARGQTVVVTRTGRRVGSPITGARSAMRRGESTFDHGPDGRQPAIPTRAAIDAHQRFLRGELG